MSFGTDLQMAKPANDIFANQKPPGLHLSLGLTFAQRRGADWNAGIGSHLQPQNATLISMDTLLCVTESIEYSSTVITFRLVFKSQGVRELLPLARNQSLGNGRSLACFWSAERRVGNIICPPSKTFLLDSSLRLMGRLSSTIYSNACSRKTSICDCVTPCDCIYASMPPASATRSNNGSSH